MISVLRGDLFMACVGFCLLVIAIIIRVINPIPVAEDADPPGQIVVDIEWQYGTTDDIDVWVKSPDDELAVGYSRKDAQTAFALERDDVGNPDPTNRELSLARSTPNGEYTVNLHLFRGHPVIPVKVKITLYPPGKPKVVLFNETVELFAEKQERTVLTFRLLNGSLVPFSTNRVFKPLRSGAK